MTDTFQLTQTVATVAIAATAIAYTVGTFLLWRTTQRSVDLARVQSRLAERASTAAILDEVFRSHREIFFRLIPPHVSLADLWENRTRFDIEGEPSEAATQRVAEDIFASILINHAARLFHHYRQGLLGDPVWQGARDDIQDLFRNPIVRGRWSAVRNFHPDDFRELVDGFLVTTP